MCAGASGGGGRSTGAEGEGGGDGTTGGTAGQERERSPEESHQERAAEAQDDLQGRKPSVRSHIQLSELPILISVSASSLRLTTTSQTTKPTASG